MLGIRMSRKRRLKNKGYIGKLVRENIRVVSGEVCEGLIGCGVLRWRAG